MKVLYMRQNVTQMISAVIPREGVESRLSLILTSDVADTHVIPREGVESEGHFENTLFVSKTSDPERGS